MNEIYTDKEREIPTISFERSCTSLTCFTNFSTMIHDASISIFNKLITVYKILKNTNIQQKIKHTKQNLIIKKTRYALNF